MDSYGQSKHLSSPLKPLIGRKAELDRLCFTLTRSDVRLVTITGTGGVGKTQLALQAAYKLQSAFPDGVYSVFLDSVINADLVLPSLANELGVYELGGHTAKERLLALLQDKCLLLFLDNFEHVIDASIFLPVILNACPNVKILVTSRIGLCVQGEQQFPLSPLSFPQTSQDHELEELTQNPAVALFLAYTREYYPYFNFTPENAPAITGICAYLEGVPLAIELAAKAGMRLFSPQMLLKHLRKHPLQMLMNEQRDAPERQRTLRKTIDWSYSLLNEQEKRLFRYLSVFIGGASLEALEAICIRLNGNNHEGFSSLATLVYHNLVFPSPENRADESHFSMLRVIHTYGRECLEVAGEVDKVERAYVVYFCELAKEIELQLSGPAQLQGLELLQKEQNNLRAVFSWLMEHEEIEQALHFCIALWKFWLDRGFVAEGFKQIEQALKASERMLVPQEARAKTQYAASLLAYFQGESAQARIYIEACLASYREMNDRHGYAIALNLLGYFELFAGNYEVVQACYEESQPILQEAGDRWHQAELLALIAGKMQAEGDYLQAQHLYEESVALGRDTGDRRALIQGLSFLEQLVCHLRDYEAALRIAQEKCEIAIELDGKPLIITCLLELSEIASMSGRTAWAAILGGAEEILREMSGDLLLSKEYLRLEKRASALRSQLGADYFAALWQQGRMLTPHQALKVETIALPEYTSHLSNQPSPKETSSHAPQYSDKLTKREVEILRLVARGFSDKQVATHLSISLRTVNTHLHKIYRKIRVNSRNKAAYYAFENKLIG